MRLVDFRHARYPSGRQVPQEAFRVAHEVFAPEPVGDHIVQISAQEKVALPEQLHQIEEQERPADLLQKRLQHQEAMVAGKEQEEQHGGDDGIHKGAGQQRQIALLRRQRPDAGQVGLGYEHPEPMADAQAGVHAVGAGRDEMRHFMQEDHRVAGQQQDEGDRRKLLFEVEGAATGNQVRLACGNHDGGKDQQAAGKQDRTAEEQACQRLGKACNMKLDVVRGLGIGAVGVDEALALE